VINFLIFTGLNSEHLLETFTGVKVMENITIILVINLMIIRNVAEVNFAINSV